VLRCRGEANRCGMALLSKAAALAMITGQGPGTTDNSRKFLITSAFTHSKISMQHIPGNVCKAVS
jgi:hypothetical protein